MANGDNRPGEAFRGSSSNSSRTEGTAARSSAGRPDTDLLRDIDDTLYDILTCVNKMSQSEARKSMPGDRQSANKWTPNRRSSSRGGRNHRGGSQSLGNFDDVLGKFTDGLEQSLLDSVLGSDFKSKIQKSMSGLASQLGVDIKDIPNALGKELGNQLKGTKIGQSVTSKLKGFTDNAMANIGDAFKQGQSAASLKRAMGKGFKPGFNILRGQGPNSQAADPNAEYAQSSLNDAQNTADRVNNASRSSSNVIPFPGSRSSSTTSSARSSVSGVSTESATQTSTDGDIVSKIADDISIIAKDVASIASKSATNPVADALIDSLSSSSADAGAEVSTNAATQTSTDAVSDLLGDASSQLSSNVDEIAGLAANAGTAGAAGALSGLASAAVAAAGPILAAVAVLMIIDKALESFGPAIEGAKQSFQAMSKAANRYNESRKKNLDLEKKRVKADVEAMASAPFDILKKAAQNLYDAWDSQIQKITASQGYGKEDVQSLMSSYAQRLRDEGLTKVVSGSDIVENLSKVIDSGLSGQVAEEFAYLATKLNAAVPTQDFFSYASTYASIAANAIKDGASQSAAIAYANAEMETFASNVLYASRQLSGGFSTGLKDAQQLFDYSVQIANASKEGNAAMISGVLTSISAITGAIAPDLASGIVESVVKAATGGNSNEIVALRSLAGINASNTEFLRALAQDPQGVFTALFSNLAKMQNMSNDNFMEVAEGLSSVFGISMDAFTRVDFNYLADAVSQMNVNNASLNENMALLASGQTTSTAEQLRMAQINQYMLEEGLAYVLDNEVARQIQQHMWDEQLARELQETTYAVELQGAALTFLEGLKQTVDNIKDFLNPLSFLKKLVQLEGTNDEKNALKADTKQLLQLGKIGKGNEKQLYNLTTTNKDLNLVSNMVELMGGKSAYASASNARKSSWGMLDVGASLISPAGLLGLVTTNSYKTKEFSDAVVKRDVKSKYAWANISKSVSQAISSTASNSSGMKAVASTNQTNSVADSIAKKSNAAFEKFLGSMEQAVADSKTYEEWTKTASKFGIKDFQAALDQFGRSEQELKGAFANQETAAGVEKQNERTVKEDEFWKQATLFSTNGQENWLTWEGSVTTNQATMISKQELILSELKTANTTLSTFTGAYNTNSHIHTALNSMVSKLGGVETKITNLYNKHKDFIRSWTDYYINHTAYSQDTMSAYKASDIIKAEKKESGDAVLALAEALTANTIGVTEGFKDPVVQTNVLLAKILIVAEAIMQQNNKTGGLSLPDSLAALATGITGQTV